MRHNDPPQKRMPVPLRALTIANVPVLLATPTAGDGPFPTVLWVHGFRADALAHARELEQCADAGFLAVGVDAVGHGARRDDGIAERIANANGDAMPVMLALVDQTLAEVPALIATLAKSHNADVTRVSLVGISMGAFLAYSAVTTIPHLRCVVALLGSPEQQRACSPHESLKAFRDVALLSVTAEHDESVPPEPTRRFHDTLSAYFNSPRHQYYELRGSGHLTSAAHWSEAMQVTMRWLDRYAR